MMRCVTLICVLCVSLAVTQALADEASSVAVKTRAVRLGTVPDIVTAYGLAGPALAANMTLSFQQEGRVLAIAVTPGETVKAGMQLLDFGASAGAISAYEQAVSALNTSREQRGHTAELLAQRLATHDQLAQADKAVADAQATVDAMKREGADKSRQTLSAPFDGIIATIAVSQGDRVQPGAALMTITRLDGLVVTVGIEPAARSRVKVGNSAELMPLSGDERLKGCVIRIDGALNPKTRLLDADISVPAGSVVSGAAFKADITVGHLTGWIVPHDAVLRDTRGDYLFQAMENTATRVDVKVVGSAGNDDVVKGALDPKRPVIVEGNYQLTDKAAIREGASR